MTDAGIATLQTALPLATITASRPPYTCHRDVKARAAETVADAIDWETRVDGSNQMTNRNWRLSLSGFAGILLAVLIISHRIQAHAESLPTKGKFRDVYQVNRAGVGRFYCFIIPKALKEQLAPYEGKYIELEVVKARQPVNPGPAIVDQIGKVTELPSPPLRLDLQAVPSATNTGKTIDVIYSLANVGKEEITFNASNLKVGVRGYRPSSNDERQDDFFLTGYTRRHLSFGETLLQRWNFISPMNPGESTHFCTGNVLLQPGETVPFVLHHVELQPGQYELAGAASFYPTNDQTVPVVAAKSLDIPLTQPKRTHDASLEAQVQVTHDDEWLVVDGHVMGKAGAEVWLFTLSEGGKYLLPGLVQLYAVSGDLLPAQLDWRRPDGAWRRTQVDREGLPFMFRIRQADRFSSSSIKRIGFWTVTQRGIEQLTLADELAEMPQRPLSPWGQTVEGCRLRIQMPRESFKAGEDIRFFFQAESDGKRADMVWINERSFKTHVVVTVDGNTARIETTGISDGHVNLFPFWTRFMRGNTRSSCQFRETPELTPTCEEKSSASSAEVCCPTWWCSR